jgi:hypothetical protein
MCASENGMSPTRKSKPSPYTFVMIFISSVGFVLIDLHYLFSSGCRADASEAAIILLPSNITVFTLDFSGSGLSEGEHVTLGWNEVSSCAYRG